MERAGRDTRGKAIDANSSRRAKDLGRHGQDLRQREDRFDIEPVESPEPVAWVDPIHRAP